MTPSAQSLGALGRANANRLARAASKVKLRDCDAMLTEFGRALTADEWRSATAVYLVSMMRDWGPRRASSACLRAGVSESVTVGHLTARQRAALMRAAEDPSFSWTEGSLCAMQDKMLAWSESMAADLQ